MYFRRLPADLLPGEDLLGDSLGVLEVLRVLERLGIVGVLERLGDLEDLGVLEPLGVLEDLEADLLLAGAEVLLVVDLLPATGDLDLSLEKEAVRLEFSTRPDMSRRL